MMMTTTPLYARAGAAAIAAVLALPSTLASAQDASPATDPAPSVSPAPAPAADSVPTTSEVDTTTPDVAPSPAPTAVKRATTSTKTRTTAARTVTRKPAPAAAATAAAPLAAPAPAPIPEAQPVMQSAAVPPQQSAARPANNDLALEFGAGALALLALGGAALAVTRRRRLTEDEMWDDETIEPVADAEPEPMVLSEPIAEEEPAMIVPPFSAFAWGSEPRHDLATDGRNDSESWTERAMRGPSPDNPSQSLKKRLKRAAFFEKRDREVAAGDGCTGRLRGWPAGQSRDRPERPGNRLTALG